MGSMAMDKPLKDQIAYSLQMFWNVNPHFDGNGKCTFYGKNQIIISMNPSKFKWDKDAYEHFYGIFERYGLALDTYEIVFELRQIHVNFFFKGATA